MIAEARSHIFRWRSRYRRRRVSSLIRMIANEARSTKSAITSLISNKCEWNYCLLNSLNSQNLKYEIRVNSKKNLMKMRCCITPCGETDLRSLQKTFLTFSGTSKRRHWSKLSTKKVFLFFGFIQRKISFSGENIFSCRRPIVKYMKPHIHYANFYNRSTDE